MKFEKTALSLHVNHYYKIGCVSGDEEEIVKATARKTPRHRYYQRELPEGPEMLTKLRPTVYETTERQHGQGLSNMIVMQLPWGHGRIREE